MERKRLAPERAAGACHSPPLRQDRGVKTSTRKRFGGAILGTSLAGVVLQVAFILPVKWDEKHTGMSSDGSGYWSSQGGVVEVGWPQEVLLATGIAGLLLLVLPDPPRKEPPELPPFRNPDG